MKGIDEAVRMVQEGQRFLVACHRRPDADAFGSALGFAAVLQELGKDATLYVPDELSLPLHYLADCMPRVRELPAGARFDSTWVMDTAAKSLLPDGLPGHEVRGPLIIVDHHAAHVDAGVPEVVGDAHLRHQHILHARIADGAAQEQLHHLGPDALCHANAAFLL